MARPLYILTPLDNEALSRYFTAIAEARPEHRAWMEAEFDAALDAGERPKVCAERALALVGGLDSQATDSSALDPKR
jgi:hypothetical protein